MEDFFKNKINEMDDSGDGWDLPDEAVWQQAQQQIKPVFKLGVATWKIASGVFAIAVILTLGSYIWRQNQAVEKLKIELKAQNDKTQQAFNLNAELEKKYNEENSTLLNENKILKEENEALNFQKNNLEEIIKGQRQEIIGLKSVDNAIVSVMPVVDSTEKFTKTKLEIPPIEEKSSTIITASKNIHRLPPKYTAVNYANFPELIISQKIIPVKKRRGAFEVGYEFSSVSMDIPSAETINDAEKAELSELDSKVNLNSFHGVSVAYALKRNLFVRTGFRMGAGTVERFWKFIDGYDKSNEYKKPDGTVANDLNLRLSTPFSEQEGVVGMDIPLDAALQEDDFLVLHVIDNQEFNYYQLPIGLEYYLGRGRLQGQLQGGAQWNRMVFRNYDFKAWAETKNRELPISKTDVKPSSGSASNFIAVYAGLGLDYRLTTRFHLRGTFGFEYSFIEKKSVEFSRGDVTSRFMRLGINYRF